MLTTYHLLFTTEVTSPLELDEHSGSALRGSLYGAIWQRFCNNKAAATCAACPLHAICPVSAIVAPLREDYSHGRDIPRPYIILPPLDGTKRYQTGEHMTFGITLFGSIIQLLPYIVMSVRLIEAGGLGRRMRENQGGRGTFRIIRIEAYHPITKQLYSLYEDGKMLVQAPTLAVTEQDIHTRAEQLPQDRITLEFLTPTRIVDHEVLQRHLTFRTLVLRLLHRLDALRSAYGGSCFDQATSEKRENPPDLVKLAKEIVCLEDRTQWEEVKSYSNRQGRTTPTSGFVGMMTYGGDLAPFRDLLAWGEIIHIGKNAVKGNGWYRVLDGQQFEVAERDTEEESNTAEPENRLLVKIAR